ncbi:hypothetical protein INT45_003902 [Circinella minor]|uniref:Uncharacterized protein n=1 Tax=Circinella minor TaxID=1195481 RepID=A0A8H7SFG4_9FUNG|nr:hypothetical protein INT45_003902 [Circinella minor]
MTGSCIPSRAIMTNCAPGWHQWNCTVPMAWEAKLRWDQSHKSSGVHSFILNVADPCWEKIFTESQLKKIKTHNLKPLPPLQQELKDFFKNFKNLTNVDQIWEVPEKAHFHPVKQFDLDFSKRMILDIASSYKWGHVYRIAVSGGERDLIMLIWRAIDMCFQNLQVDALSTNIFLKNYLEAINKPSLAPPDATKIEEQLEYGASENGGADEAGIGSKELIEKYIKLPKTLKDMALRLAADLDNEEKKSSIVKDSIDVVTGANDDDDDDSDTEDLTGYLPLINSKNKIIIPSALNTDTTKKIKLDDFEDNNTRSSRRVVENIHNTEAHIKHMSVMASRTEATFSIEEEQATTTTTTTNGADEQLSLAEKFSTFCHLLQLKKQQKVVWMKLMQMMKII